MHRVVGHRRRHHAFPKIDEARRVVVVQRGEDVADLVGGFVQRPGPKRLQRLLREHDRDAHEGPGQVSALGRGAGEEEGHLIEPPGDIGGGRGLHEMQGLEDG